MQINHNGATLKIKYSSIVSALIFLHILFSYCFDEMGGILGYINKGILILLVMVGFVGKVFTVKLKKNGAIIVLVVFSLYCFTLKEEIQGSWSQLLGLNLQTAITIALAVCVCLAIYFYADTKKKRELVLKYIAWAGVMLATVTLILIRGNIFSGLHSSGISPYLKQYGYQSNQMGVNFGLSFIASIYLWDIYRKRKYMFCLIINIIFLFLTGSRKALLYAIVGLFFYFIFSGRRMIALKLLVSIIALFVIYYLLITIPALYNLVGWRILSLISVLTGGEATDTTGTRINMIKFGMSMIKEEPIYGHGLNAFAVNYGKRFANTVYSHNNYIELMVSGGIVLTTMYYSRFIIVIKRLLKRMKESKEVVICMSFVLSILIADVAAVTYYYRIYYICFAFIMACAYEKEAA